MKNNFQGASFPLFRQLKKKHLKHEFVSSRYNTSTNKKKKFHVSQMPLLSCLINSQIRLVLFLHIANAHKRNSQTHRTSPSFQTAGLGEIQGGHPQIKLKAPPSWLPS